MKVVFVFWLPDGLSIGGEGLSNSNGTDTRASATASCYGVQEGKLQMLNAFTVHPGKPSLTILMPTNLGVLVAAVGKPWGYSPVQAGFEANPQMSSFGWALDALMLDCFDDAERISWGREGWCILRQTGRYQTATRGRISCGTITGSTQSSGHYQAGRLEKPKHSPHYSLNSSPANHLWKVLGAVLKKGRLNESLGHAESCGAITTGRRSPQLGCHVNRTGQTRRGWSKPWTSYSLEAWLCRSPQQLG